MAERSRPGDKRHPHLQCPPEGDRHAFSDVCNQELSLRISQSPACTANLPTLTRFQENNLLTEQEECALGVWRGQSTSQSFHLLSSLPVSAPEPLLMSPFTYISGSSLMAGNGLERVDSSGFGLKASLWESELTTR